MKLFTDDHAKMYEEDAGKPYRPSNGTEGDDFFREECRECINRSYYWGDNICETESLSFWFSDDDPLYPIELQYGPDGQPCCRRKTVLPPKPYKNIDGKKFHFNAPVIFQLCPGPIEDRCGRLVQVRKGIGAFGSDLYFLRRNDGSLITGENLYLTKYYGYVAPPDPCDAPDTEYTVSPGARYPETGFIIDNPSGPPPRRQSFAMIITED
jgi:hypothetical protein